MYSLLHALHSYCCARLSCACVYLVLASYFYGVLSACIELQCIVEIHAGQSHLVAVLGYKVHANEHSYLHSCLLTECDLVSQATPFVRGKKKGGRVW